MAFGNRLIDTGGGFNGSLSSFTLQSTSTNIISGMDIWFSPDGTRYYATQYSSNVAYIRQYLMSTPFDLSTASLEYTRNIMSEGANYQIWGICLSYDGLYGWTQKTSESGVNVYTLSTPHDFSSATYQGAVGATFGSDIIGVYRGGSRLGSVCVAPDGSYLTFGGTPNNSACGGPSIYKLISAEMPTANDISSTSRGYNKPVVCTGKSSSYFPAICYNGDGTKIYGGGSLNSGGIYEYDLSNPPYSTDGGTQVGSLGGQVGGLYMTSDNTKLFVSIDYRQGTGVLTYAAG